MADKEIASMTSYPLFRPLEKEDKPLFDRVFAQEPPLISEFTFTNLYTWRQTYDLKVSTLDDFIILCSYSMEPRRYFSPIGKGNKKSAIMRILEESGGIFIRIPEAVKLLFNKEDLVTIKLDLDNMDYVYKTEALVSLQGRKYDGKRNLIKKFKSTYAYDYVRLDESNVMQCLEFEEAWCSIKNCDSIEGLNNERKTIREIVENFSLFNLIGGAIKVKEDMRAVAIAQRLNSTTMVMHVLKADPGMNGLYQTLLNEFLSHEGHSFEYVNLEQDLGIDGLKKAKFSYHPIKMINKYTLSLK